MLPFEPRAAWAGRVTDFEPFDWAGGPGAVCAVLSDPRAAGAYGEATDRRTVTAWIEPSKQIEDADGRRESYPKREDHKTIDGTVNPGRLGAASTVAPVEARSQATVRECPRGS